MKPFWEHFSGFWVHGFLSRAILLKLNLTFMSDFVELRVISSSNESFLYFRSLKEEEDFVDVTLSCEDSQYTAHKVVLSACSPYFRKLLKVRRHSQSFSSCYKIPYRFSFPTYFLGMKQSVRFLFFWFPIINNPKDKLKSRYSENISAEIFDSGIMIKSPRIYKLYI